MDLFRGTGVDLINVGALGAFVLRNAPELWALVWEGSLLLGHANKEAATLMERGHANRYGEANGGSVV